MGNRRKSSRHSQPRPSLHRLIRFEQLESRELLAVDLRAAGGGPPPALYSIDGSNNNLAHPTWGQAGTNLLRLAPAQYADGVSSPGGANRPSPRAISNAISDQGSQDIISDRMLSAMTYAWGQFIDHDLDLTPTGNTEPLHIAVPTGDPYFDPNSTGTQTIDTSRSIFDSATGTTNPRQQVNTITAWLDGSMIYGSDSTTAAALRTMSDGKLKSSPGNLLPWNTAEYFPDGTLNMAAMPGMTAFAAGDIRANENVELIAMQTLFLREHNYWATQIKEATPTLTDEQIFQRARSIVIAEIQAITYNQWLPALLGPGALRPYAGYRPQVNAGIANEFSTAAFRFGHSLLGDDVGFLDNNGREVRDEISLSEAFFNTSVVSQMGVDPMLKYLASDPASELDTKVVGSVRNFLFGPPGSGGLDLASLNIERGRDHGLADYNTTRQAYGLPRVTSFSQITSNRALQTKLQQTYGSVNNIDLWVGALAEDHVRGASVGPTLRAIIADQFTRLRDGDRLWYQNNFSGPLLRQLDNTSLADVIRRNSGISNLQGNVFFFQAGISGTVFADVNRDGRLNPGERPVANRTVQLIDAETGDLVASTRTDGMGNYLFNVSNGVRTGTYQVRVLAADGTRTEFTTGNLSITRGDQLLRGVNLAVAPPPRPSNVPPPPPHADATAAKPAAPKVDPLAVQMLLRSTLG